MSSSIVIVKDFFLSAVKLSVLLLNFNLTHFHVAELTKQEIQTLEGKLIKHFSKQLATRAALNQSQLASVPEISRFPSLSQWLAVVGITKDSADVIQVKYDRSRCYWLREQM